MKPKKHEAMLQGRNPEFDREVHRTAAKAGKEKLTRGELLLLACDALSRTCTYDEKGYENQLKIED